MKLKFEDLSAAEQALYRRAEERLQSEDLLGDEPCEVCRMAAPDHRIWCPMGADDDDELLAA